MSTERVQKILAQAGIASRRKAEELITEGLVTINGKVAKLGDKAEFGKDAIKVKGKLLQSQAEPPVYLAFNKPKGVISTLTDPEGRPTLSEFLRKVKTRVFPLGRLDFNSDGLMILTNDGAFAEKVQKNEEILRVYLVKIKGHPSAEMLSRLDHPAKMGPGRFFKPYSVRLAQGLQNKSQIEVVIQGGGAFDIKAFFEMKGFLVVKITRTAIGHITLKGMKPGDFRYLKGSQVLALLEQPELALRKLEEDSEPAKIIPKKRIEPVQSTSKQKPKVVIKPVKKPVKRVQPKKFR
jgi:23S rRNA pseudouridine2605 synthase